MSESLPKFDTLNVHIHSNVDQKEFKPGSRCQF